MGETKFSPYFFSRNWNIVNYFETRLSTSLFLTEKVGLTQIATEEGLFLEAESQKSLPI